MADPTPEQWQEFYAMGDFNWDGYITRADATILAQHYEGTGAEYDPTYDLNRDGVVNVYDAVTLAGNYGLNIWEYYGLGVPLCPFTRLARFPTLHTIICGLWLRLPVHPFVNIMPQGQGFVYSQTTVS